MSPKFKSKVEQFYYDNVPTDDEEGEVDGSSNEDISGDATTDMQRLSEARKGAYGDGRKSFFSFDNADQKSYLMERGAYGFMTD